MANIDLTYLEEISGGDTDFIADMILTFLEETPKDVEEMKKLLDNADWKGIGLLAHKLKSSIKMFGFDGLKNKAVFIEQSGRNNENIAILGDKVNEFLIDINEALNELRAHG